MADPETRCEVTAAERITRTRAALVLDHPWFGALALRLRVVEDETIQWLGTDGSVLAFNPAGVVERTDSELRAGVAHEVLHCALLHPYRFAALDHELANVAADHVVNLQLLGAGFTLWAGAYAEPRFAGMTFEQVYATLQRERKPADDGASGGKPGEDASNGAEGAESAQNGTGPMDGQPDMSPAPEPGKSGPATAVGEPEPMSETDWQIAAEQAAMVGRKAGTMPGGVDQALAAGRRSGLDWREVLREFVEHVQPSDYSYQSPQRALLGHGLFVPGLVRENCPALDVYVDVSSSTGSCWAAFGAELTAIMHECRPERLRVIYCNTEVTGCDEFGPDDPAVELRARMGGGTAFEPAFEYARATGELPAAGVYLTDCEGPAPRDPGYPVLWVTPAFATAEGAFGRTVRMPA